MLAWAQAPTGSVHGIGTANADLRLVPADRSTIFEFHTEARGTYHFDALTPGWYILAASSDQSPEAVKAVKVLPGQDVNAGEWTATTLRSVPHAVRVMTVCEALADRAARITPAIIVGIFKSGMDQTLRQDCPNQLMSGEVGWASAIALSGSTEPPDQYRAQIQKKKLEIYASYPSEAKPRPERLIGLYGVLVMPGGLTSAPCCHAKVETTMAPARLIGVDEKDYRVIR